MSKHDEARRAFLIGAAVGAGAVAGAGLVPEALAQTHEQHQAKTPQPRLRNRMRMARGMALSSTTTMPPRLRRSPSG